MHTSKVTRKHEFKFDAKLIIRVPEGATAEEVRSIEADAVNEVETSVNECTPMRAHFFLFPAEATQE